MAPPDDASAAPNGGTSSIARWAIASRRAQTLTLAQDGFLSLEIDALAAEAFRDFAPAEMSLVERVNRFAISVARVPRDLQRRDADLFAAALLSRAIQDFEGAVTLAGRGLRAQSRAAARATFETALYCAAAARDLVLEKGLRIKLKKGDASTTRFVDAFEGGHQRFRGQVATELQRIPETSQEHAGAMARVLDEIGTPGQHQDIDLRGLAEDLQLQHLFTVVYRPLSQDAHPSATSLQHHVELTPQGKIAGLRIGPDYDQFADTLMLAACSMLVALDSFLDRFGTPEELEYMKDLAGRYRALSESSQEGSADAPQ